MTCNACEHCFTLPSPQATLPQAMIAYCGFADLDSNGNEPRSLRMYSEGIEIETPAWCPETAAYRERWTDEVQGETKRQQELFK